MTVVSVRFHQGAAASIGLDDELSILDVSATGFDQPDDLRSEIGDTALIEGRSRIGGVELLNVNAFPIAPIPGARDLGAIGHRIDEDVTIDLAEGRGAACAWSSRLDALTVWWLADEHEAGGDCTFSFFGRSAQVPVSAMRSFRSANSPRYSPTVINIAALPREVLAQAGARGGWERVAVVTDSFELEAMLELGDNPRVQTFSVGSYRSLPEQRAAVRDLPWETVAEVDPLIPQFCVNNHPQVEPVEEPPGPPEPGEEPTSPGEPEEDDGSEEEEGASEEGFADGWIDDFVAVRVPRSGGVANLLRLGEPPCMAGTSPTINCLTFYWLSRSGSRDDRAAVVEIDGASLPHRNQTQRLRRTLSDTACLDIQINSIQVPLAAIAASAGRRDLLPGETKALTS